VSNTLKIAALTVLAIAASNVYADPAETKGGLLIKTEDGRFEGKVGGRIQFDTFVPVSDDDLASGGLDSGTAFRRARLTLEGKAYGWKYKFENDFTGGASGGGFREMWIGTTVYDQNLRIGQAKPYRGMEELTSSNEILFMERPFATASGIYAGNQFAQGLFLDGSANNFTWGVSAYSLHNEAEVAGDGVGAAGRLTYAPVNDENNTLHIGGTVSKDSVESAAGTAIGTINRSASGRAFGRISGGTTIATTNFGRQAYGAELAAKYGPIFFQGEYATAEYEGVTSAADEQVDTFYVSASYLITGETRSYDAKKGVFKSPKPTNSYGAWEAKVRYDVMEGEGVDDEINQIIVGANWFVNPNVRFMFEYVTGERVAADDEVSVLQARAQFGF